jgi:Ca2+/Na+ antiporter
MCAGLSPAIAGATLLALGAQVPDTFASVGMAKQDMASNAAVSNGATIAREVIISIVASLFTSSRIVCEKFHAEPI